MPPVHTHPTPVHAPTTPSLFLDSAPARHWLSIPRSRLAKALPPCWASVWSPSSSSTPGPRSPSLGLARHAAVALCLLLCRRCFYFTMAAPLQPAARRPPLFGNDDKQRRQHRSVAEILRAVPSRPPSFPLDPRSDPSARRQHPPPRAQTRRPLELDPSLSPYSSPPSGLSQQHASHTHPVLLSPLPNSARRITTQILYCAPFSSHWRRPPPARHWLYLPGSPILVRPLVPLSGPSCHQEPEILGSRSPVVDGISWPPDRPTTNNKKRRTGRYNTDALVERLVCRGFGRNNTSSHRQIGLLRETLDLDLPV